jgi:hypothetical protein
MNIKDLKQSQFLKKEDVGNGVLATIRDCTQENVALPGAPEQLKWVLHFDELEKPLVLNSTNGQIIAQFIKSEETDNWIGHKIVMYSDPSIQFQGKLVGGIRVRAPRGQAAKGPATAKPVTPAAPPTPPTARGSAQAEELNPADDDVPF